MHSQTPRAQLSSDKPGGGEHPSAPPGSPTHQDGTLKITMGAWSEHMGGGMPTQKLILERSSSRRTCFLCEVTGR
ncbi:hypothetical protein T484DRAFT_3193863 [Baffinella frigidus]|nr:hypothetical protein T484DRAFT_3193863 [Cryptophyta sp. CCMP2293]